MRCLNSALTIDGSLSADEVKKRTIMFVFCVASTVGNLFTSWSYGYYRQGRTLNMIGVSVFNIGCWIVVGKVLCKQQLHTRFVVGMLYLFGICIFIWDLDTRALTVPPIINSVLFYKILISDVLIYKVVN